GLFSSAVRTLDYSEVRRCSALPAWMLVAFREQLQLEVLSRYRTTKNDRHLLREADPELTVPVSGAALGARQDRPADEPHHRKPPARRVHHAHSEAEETEEGSERTCLQRGCGTLERATAVR